MNLKVVNFRSIFRMTRRPRNLVTFERPISVFLTYCLSTTLYHSQTIFFRRRIQFRIQINKSERSTLNDFKMTNKRKIFFSSFGNRPPSWIAWYIGSTTLPRVQKCGWSEYWRSDPKLCIHAGRGVYCTEITQKSPLLYKNSGRFAFPHAGFL